jgi:hypothetical protein
MAKRRCKATTKAGKRCKAAPLKGKDYCSAHDPDAPGSTRFGSPEQAREAGMQGGRPRSPRPHEELQRRIEEDIDRWLAPFEAALGGGKPMQMWDAEEGKHHIEFVPDPQLALKAVKLAFDRVYGRPRQQFELTGEDGGAVRISQEEFADPETRKALRELAGKIGDARAERSDGTGSDD